MPLLHNNTVLGACALCFGYTFHFEIGSKHKINSLRVLSWSIYTVDVYTMYNIVLYTLRKKVAKMPWKCDGETVLRDVLFVSVV